MSQDLPDPGRLPGRPSLAARAARIINPPSEAAEPKANRYAAIGIAARPARIINPPSKAAGAKAARQRNPAGDAIITGGARRMEAKTANPLPTLKKEPIESEPIESTAAPPTRLSPREARRIKDEVFKRPAAADSRFLSPQRRILAKDARDRKKAADLLTAAGYVARKDEEEEEEEEEEQEEQDESEEAEGDAEEEEEDEEEEQEEETTEPVMKKPAGMKKSNTRSTRGAEKQEKEDETCVNNEPEKTPIMKRPACADKKPDE